MFYLLLQFYNTLVGAKQVFKDYVFLSKYMIRGFPSIVISLKRISVFGGH